jgi:tRNA (cytidine/uridine-2'-O-)-methyltransferase
MEKNMFNIVLVEPEIPQNTGNIVRTCAATGCKLHLVRPLGFEVSDKYLKRAGLDYWHFVDISYWDSFEELAKANPDGKFYFFTTKGRKIHSDAKFEDGDFLVFGKETKGLPEELLKAHPDECLRIPMIDETRSLNLSNSVAIAVYEALRQHNYEHLKTAGELHRLRWED